MRPGGMYSLIFKKLKLERNWKKIVHCSLLQKPFGPFLEEKKRKKLMSNFLLAFILWCFTVGRFLQIFLKILIFKVPEIFWQWKLSCAVEFADFFKLDLYINIPDWQKCVAYLKSPKVLNHSALLCIVCNLTPPPPPAHHHHQEDQLYSFFLSYLLKRSVHRVNFLYRARLNCIYESENIKLFLKN